jgi:hypothetical protein
MSLEIRTGPRGPAALWDGRQLASAYDAEREARRWAEPLAVTGTLIFVAGDPWGLAAKALADAGAKSVALLAGAAARAHVPSGVTTWAPEDGGLERFLRKILDDWGPDAVSWQVWPAFERYAPDLAMEWTRLFRDVYRTVQGSWLTQTRFGPRFWTNAVRNLLDWEQATGFRPGSRPVVIAASGPSLEESLPLLKEHRNRFDLWSLPSSFEVLLRRDLVPDAGIATDGGYYAREHLQRLAGTQVPVMAAMTSAPDPVLAERPMLFFSQGMAVERALLGSVMSNFGEIPSQGTVAVTAIELALGATTGPVFILGLDLAFHDLRAHASPHTVDRRLSSAISRLTPHEGRLAESLFAQAPVWSDGARTSPALLTYAGWFRSSAHFRRTVYRVAPSALRWNSMTEVTAIEAARLWRSSKGEAVGWERLKPWSDGTRRRQAVDAALEQLLERVGSSAADDPWLIDAARTGAPYALAEDFKAKRTGRTSSQAKQELAAMIRTLRDR